VKRLHPCHGGAAPSGLEIANRWSTPPQRRRSGGSTRRESSFEPLPDGEGGAPLELNLAGVDPCTEAEHSHGLGWARRSRPAPFRH
jgi:hypothetical protein